VRYGLCLGQLLGTKASYKERRSQVPSLAGPASGKAYTVLAGTWHFLVVVLCIM
jgi:hypothetical protein